MMFDAASTRSDFSISIRFEYKESWMKKIDKSIKRAVLLKDSIDRPITKILKLLYTKMQKLETAFCIKIKIRHSIKMSSA